MSKTRNPDALIRIEDAIKVLCRGKCHPGMLCPDNYCAEMWDAFKDVERVDAVPVRHGRWIPVSSYDACGGDEATWAAHGDPIAYYYCSECKQQARAGEDGESLLTKYCPDCGADMRKDGEQHD